MAFSSETKIFTSQGWKLIRDISGHDRILVRNFLGDAEFQQPFALRKRHYEGEMIKLGGQHWAVSVTPEHEIVYNDPNKIGHVPPTPAKEVIVGERPLYRRFRYTQESKTYESITLKNGNSSRRVVVSIEDWYTIVAFTVLFGYIDKRKNPHIQFVADADKLFILTTILDNIGLKWTQSTKHKGAPAIFLPNTSNLVSKLIRFLGHRERRDMRLPSRAIYRSSAAHLRHFVDNIIALDSKPIVERPDQYSFVTVNNNLVENLEIMCLLAGYGFSRAGDDRSHRVRIAVKPIKSWHVRFIEKESYSGYIYEIDLFEGLVYVTERSLPIWMSPK